jgi:hypothetical protein
MSTIYTVACYPTAGVTAVVIAGGGMVSATPGKLFVCRYNTNSIVAQGIYDNDQQAFWTNAASVSGTLLDEFGNTIFNIPLSYVAASLGVFQGDVGDNNFGPTLGRGYTLVIAGVNGGHYINMPIPVEVVRSGSFLGAPVFNFPGAGPTPVTPTPAPLVGVSRFHLVAGAGDNSQLIASGPHVVVGYAAYDSAGYQLFIKLFDTLAPPVVGTSPVKMTIGLQAGQPAASSPGVTVAFNNGIGIGIVKGIADSDDTPVLAGDCVVDVFYQ